MNDKDTVAADAAAPTHADDTAVDEFAAVMKEKLAQARAKGRGGWETCNPADLSRMLREHVEKGDPRDVANFCMFLWFHRSPITSTQPDERAACDLPLLPAPLEIDWPELHSQALGCGVEDRNIRDRYEAAEYGWQDGVDKAAERVPEEIFTADQMREYALVAVARATAPQATVTDDEILDEYAKHVRTTYAGGVNVLSAMEPEGFVKAVRALLSRTGGKA